MINNNAQKEKAQHFHELHHTGKMLILPNIWDALGAALLESLAYPAIATASASIAFTMDTTMVKIFLSTIYLVS